MLYSHIGYYFAILFTYSYLLRFCPHTLIYCDSDPDNTVLCKNDHLEYCFAKLSHTKLYCKTSFSHISHCFYIPLFFSPVQVPCLSGSRAPPFIRIGPLSLGMLLQPFSLMDALQATADPFLMNCSRPLILRLSTICFVCPLGSSTNMSTKTTSPSSLTGKASTSLARCTLAVQWRNLTKTRGRWGIAVLAPPL